MVNPIKATVSLPVTTYTIEPADPEDLPITMEWSGWNCGSPTGSTTATLVWDHGSNYCPHTTVAHAEVTITVVVSDGFWNVTCRYKGAAAGTGLACDDPVESP